MSDIYDSAAEYTARKIRSVSDGSSLVFPIITDAHLHDPDCPAAIQLNAALQALSKVITPTAVLDIGDNLAMIGREEHASNEHIRNMIIAVLERVNTIFSCPVLAVNGNHDGIGTDFFNKDFWYDIVCRGYDNGMANRRQDNPYYTVDYTAQRIRLVCLSLPSGSNLAVEHPTPDWKFGDDQLKWLAETALATNFSVLVVVHVPFYYRYFCEENVMIDTWNGNTATTSDVASLCGWIEDADDAVSILEAFHTHSPLTVRRLGINMPASPEKAELIACISGHIHSESLWQPHETRGMNTNPLPVSQIVVPSSNPELNHQTRGTELPALDIMVLTKKNRTIAMIRFGPGEDRVFHW